MQTPHMQTPTDNSSEVVRSNRSNKRVILTIFAGAILIAGLVGLRGMVSASAGAGLRNRVSARVSKIKDIVTSLRLGQSKGAQTRGAAGGSTDSQNRTRQVSTVKAGATFTVNDTGDAPDATIGDGLCATAGAVCTLRAAIAEANATTAADVINITATGTVSLSTPLPDITQSLTIDGPGFQQLLVRRSKENDLNSGWADASPAPASQFRIFTVPSSGLEIVIRDISVGHGNSIGTGYGGNIFTRSNITLQDVEIRYGMAGIAIVNPIGHAGGGGLAVENANATIERCQFTLNLSRVPSTTQQYKDAFGGGILFLANNGGTRLLTLVNTIMHTNGTNTSGALTGGEGIQLVTEANTESIANITNVTFWDYGYTPELGSHTTGAGAKATYNVRNSLFLSSHQGSYSASMARGAAAADNHFTSLGTTLSQDYLTGYGVLNGLGYPLSAVR